MVNGCGGRICRACRPIMRKMVLVRYPLDQAGERTGEPPAKGWACGFICSPDTTSLRYDLPGRSGDELLRMVVAASSISPLMVGDIVSDRGTEHQIVSVGADGSVMLRPSC